MKKLVGTISILAAMLWVFPAQAHHAFAATFTNEVITVSGVVNRVNFSNPHVMIYFDVTDANGEVTEWVSEGGAATSLRSRGWSRDTLKGGDHITISGNSTRNGSPMISMEEINLVHPQTGELLGDPGSVVTVAEVAFSTSIPMTLPDGRPNLSGSWVQNPIVPGAPPRRRPGAGGPPAPTKSPNTIDLPGGFRFDEAPQLTAAGEALHASFDAKNDPQVQCEPPGLVRQVGTPHPIRIQQLEDRIELAYEEYAGMRTVYFDDRDLVGGDVSRFGQSIARYEGDTLIIETTHLSGNWASPFGPILSDQTTSTERYYRLPDENGVSMIAWHMSVEDPVMLAAPYDRYRYTYNAENYEFIEVNCQVPLTN